jgi:DNA-binding NarL/FixJ family response regulator
VIKIFIADDHQIIREGVKKIIAGEGDIRVVGEAENSIVLKEKLMDSDADIILLDLSMPGTDFFGLISEVKKISPNTGILIVTMYPPESYALRAFESGANGFISKNDTVDNLVTAIRSIIHTGRYISPEIGFLLADALEEKEASQPHKTLSHREMEVLRLISKGKTIKEIAEKLSLSISTVNTYRLRVLKKMKMKTDADLVRYAMENKLII